MSLLSHLLAGSEKEEVYATSALTYLLGREAHYRDALVADWASLTARRCLRAFRFGPRRAQAMGGATSRVWTIWARRTCSSKGSSGRH